MRAEESILEILTSGKFISQKYIILDSMLKYT